MIISPFSEELLDPITTQCLEGISKGMEKNNDDGFIVCGGRRGTGKTSLMFHAYKQYAGQEANIEQVAFNQKEMSIALDNASKAKGARFVGYDEANVSKRDALTRWNKRLMDTYLNIRGLNIFHWWNNPSIEMLDKPFIEECVKGIIFIITKSKSKPRHFFYFTQEGVLRLLEDQGNLKTRTLIKYGSRYAHHLGWFRPYKNHLWPEYLAKKQSRMLEKVGELREEFAPQEKLSLLQYAKKNHLHDTTVKRIVLYGIEAGLLKKDVHFLQSGTGAYKLLEEGVKELDHLRSTKDYTVKYGRINKRRAEVLSNAHNINVKTSGDGEQ